MPDPIRALFAGGPLDGRLDLVRDQAHLEAVERSGPPMPRDLEDPAWADVELRKVVYRQHPVTDLDGTRIAIYARDEDLVPRSRGRGPERLPNVTLWGLASDLASERQRVRELEDELRAARAREAWAVRHADALAADLALVRIEAATATSGDD